MSDELALFRDVYLANAEAVPYHAKWVKANPGEVALWLPFRDAVLAGEDPEPPALRTKYGKALVAAGRMHMALRAYVVGTPTPPDTFTPLPAPPPLPPSPDAASSWDSPLTITAGGTYEGNWESSSSSTPAIFVNTSEPVIIQNSQVRNLANGRLIRDAWGSSNSDITLRNVVGWGGTHRFIEVEGHKRLVIENCTINKTGGIRTNVDAADSLTIIRYNRHLNAQATPEGAGNFVQLNSTANGRIYIEWNEVVNEYDLSNPEDLVSCFAIENALIQHNMFWHQSLPGNAYNSSSQNGITLEEGPISVTVRENQLVDGYGILISTNGGSNNVIEDNRIVADRLLPNGQTKGNGWSYPLVVVAGTNNHAHDNYVSYIDRDGVQGDDFFDVTYPTHGAYQLRGAAEGGVTEFANNTLVLDPDEAAEEAEWALWQEKLDAHGITIGAS